MKTICVNIHNNCIDMDYTPLITGNVETIAFSFTFNDAWEGYAKTAVFYTDEDEKTIVVIANNRCLVPAECLEAVAPLYFGVYGVMDEKRIVTETKCLILEQGAYGTGSAPSAPTPDVYAQIMTVVEECLSETDATLDEIEAMTDAISAAEAARETASATAVAAANGAASSATIAAAAANEAAETANSSAAVNLVTEAANAADSAALSELEAAAAQSSASAAETSAAAAAASAAASAAGLAGKQDKWVGKTVSISASDWHGGLTCVKSVSGVTSSNLVICDPSDPGVSCTAQGNGTLTFSCVSTPSAAVTVKAVIFA